MTIGAEWYAFKDFIPEPFLVPPCSEQFKFFFFWINVMPLNNIRFI